MDSQNVHFILSLRIILVNLIRISLWGGGGGRAGLLALRHEHSSLVLRLLPVPFDCGCNLMILVYVTLIVQVHSYLEKLGVHIVIWRSCKSNPLVTLPGQATCSPDIGVIQGIFSLALKVVAAVLYLISESVKMIQSSVLRALMVYQWRGVSLSCLCAKYPSGISCGDLWRSIII